MKLLWNRAILTLLVIVSANLTADAQKKNIVLHYDFKNVEGMVVKDRGPHHVDAVMKNGAEVENSTLVLGNSDGYLDMTAKAGEVVSHLADFTISARYYVDPSAEMKGYGYFLWCFSCKEANQEKEGPYHAYRINEQRCETSIGGWSQETGIQEGSLSEKGEWIRVVFRQKSGKGELYVNGKLIGTENNFPELKNIFTSAPSFNWIGRPPFNGDNYLKNTKVSDFRIYDKCINDKELKKLIRN